VTEEFHFQIVARADPQVTLRVLNYFAQQALLPSRVQMRVVDGLLKMTLRICLGSEHSAEIIAEKMRQNFLVDSVKLRRLRAMEVR
jgi:hypothetical protein